MASTTSGVGNAPVKAPNTASSREARSRKLERDDLIVFLEIGEFKSKFLNKAKLDPKTKSRSNLSALRTVITQHAAVLNGKSEADAYDPVCTLLNIVCNFYYKTENVKDEDKITFFDHHSHSPHLHPHAYIEKHAKQKPDIGVAKKSYVEIWLEDVRTWELSAQSVNKPAIQWSLLRSLLEGKKDNIDPVYQTATYSGSLLQARPDMPGNFTISYTSSVFRVLWCDPCGVYSTPNIPWNDEDTANILLAYIHFLHHPLLVDLTVTMQERDHSFDCLSLARWNKKSYAHQPVWIIQAGEREYEVNRIAHIGEPWSRMNMVWVSTRYGPIGRPRNTGPAIFIKDSFPDSRRIKKSSEGAILDQIHQNGEHIQGVVVKLDHFEVRNPNGTLIRNIQVDSTMIRRTKVRCIFDGPLLPSLVTCESVYEFMKVMYDLVELLVFTHKYRGVLHGDISPFNVMRQTFDQVVPSAERKLCNDQPIFISSLLAYETLQGPRETFIAAHNRPSCLLIDFDNALMDDTPTGVPRTGTAAFVARAVNVQCTVGTTPYRVTPVPDLTGHAKDSYVALHGNDVYDSQSRLHDDLPEPLEEVKFACIPRHDVESCYWIIVWWLMRALPVNTDDEVFDETEAMNKVFQLIEGHNLDNHHLIETRANILTFVRRQWENILHPKLHSLAPFLARLTKLVEPDYALIPELDQYNIHEAMKRLLLQEIWRLKESGDLLNVQQKQRSFTKPIDGCGATEPSNYSKRKFDEDTTKEELDRIKKLKASSTSNPNDTSIPKTSDTTSASGRTVRPRRVKK